MSTMFSSFLLRDMTGNFKSDSELNASRTYVHRVSQRPMRCPKIDFYELGSPEKDKSPYIDHKS